jgi:hypothetical protein
MANDYSAADAESDTAGKAHEHFVFSLLVLAEAAEQELSEKKTCTTN